MIPGLREAERPWSSHWDDDLDDDFEGELDDLEPDASSAPRADVCGGLASWDGFDLDALGISQDASGQRARKVTETFESGETVKRVTEKLYLGGVEVKRIKTVDMSTLDETQLLDRSDLHVMDDKSRIAIVPRWTQDDLLTEIENTSWLDTNRPRYQYGNHLGSASLELDTTGQIISYEEYYPYGGTSFIAGNSQAEVKLKEYRYTGKERDDTTGLYYYGQRYYAPWLGRWMSADPAGPVDGLNLYVYVSGNPVRMNDPNGTDGADVDDDITDYSAADTDVAIEELPPQAQQEQSNPSPEGSGSLAFELIAVVHEPQEITLDAEQGMQEPTVEWYAVMDGDIQRVESIEQGKDRVVIRTIDAEGNRLDTVFNRPGTEEIVAPLPGGETYTGPAEGYGAAASRAQYRADEPLRASLYGSAVTSIAYGVAYSVTGDAREAAKVASIAEGVQIAITVVFGAALATRGAKPNQLHHFATNKSKVWTPRLQKIADRYGLKLDEIWNKELLPHQGRHPNEYHRFVQRGMNRAAREAGADKSKFLNLFDRYVRKPVRDNPDLLRKAGWE